jgi:hypothetical protein
MLNNTHIRYFNCLARNLYTVALALALNLRLVVGYPRRREVHKGSVAVIDVIEVHSKKLFRSEILF